MLVLREAGWKVYKNSLDSLKLFSKFKIIPKLKKNLKHCNCQSIQLLFSSIIWSLPFQVHIILTGNEESSSNVGPSTVISSYQWIFQYRQTSFYYASLYCISQLLNFLQIESCGNSASSNYIGTIFPTAFAHFMYLCLILVILAIFQTLY